MSVQTERFCQTAVVECEDCNVRISVSLVEAPEIMAAFLQSHDAVWIHPVRPYVPIPRTANE